MMKIGRVHGIQLKLSNFLPALFFVYYLLGMLDLALMVFAVVIAHEMGHVVTALYLGVRVDTIELFPFGGIARMQNPYLCSLRKEITIAIMGPLVNMALGCFFWAALYLNLGNPEVISFLLKVTLFMGAFNLLPVLPLDGGRIFRAFLARLTGFFYATRLVSNLGQFCAWGLFVFGTWEIYHFWANFHWWLVAVYLYCIAKQEKKLAFLSFMRYLTHKEKEIQGAGFLPAVVLAAVKDVCLKRVIEKLAPHKYHLIYVIDPQGKLLGLITEETVIKAALREGMQITLEEVLNKQHS